MLSTEDSIVWQQVMLMYINTNCYLLKIAFYVRTCDANVLNTNCYLLKIAFYVRKSDANVHQYKLLSTEDSILWHQMMLMYIDTNCYLLKIAFYVRTCDANEHQYKLLSIEDSILCDNMWYECTSIQIAIYWR